MTCGLILFALKLQSKRKTNIENYSLIIYLKYIILNTLLSMNFKQKISITIILIVVLVKLKPFKPNLFFLIKKNTQLQFFENCFHWPIILNTQIKIIRRTFFCQTTCFVLVIFLITTFSIPNLIW